MPSKGASELSTGKIEPLVFQTVIGFITLVGFLSIIFLGYLAINKFGFNILWILPVGFISWIVGHYLLRIINA